MGIVQFKQTVQPLSSFYFHQNSYVFDCEFLGDFWNILNCLKSKKIIKMASEAIFDIAKLLYR